MAKITYRQMPAPQDLPQQIPAPQAKARIQKPEAGGKSGANSGGVRGRGMVLAKIGSHIVTGKQFTINYHTRSFNSPQNIT